MDLKIFEIHKLEWDATSQAFSKLIEFSKFLFSLVDLLNETRLEIFFNQLGRTQEVPAQGSSVLEGWSANFSSWPRNLNICRRPKIMMKIRLRFNYQISKRFYGLDIKTNGNNNSLLMQNWMMGFQRSKVLTAALWMSLGKL